MIRLKARNLLKCSGLIVISAFFLFSSFNNIFAQARIESPNYQIEFPNFNSGAGIPTSSNFRTDATIGQVSQGLSSSAGFNVRAGFEYIHSIIPFSFSVSNTSINFGTVQAQSPVTRTSNLTVKAGGAGGYRVSAQENHPITTISKNASIPDTTCDNKSCTQTQASVWNKNTTYGFGFNIQGDDIPSDFTSNTYFRQFADASSEEAAVIIMEKSEVTWDYPDNAWPWESQATVTYKLNISGAQEPGSYFNFVTFTAIPSF